MKREKGREMEELVHFLMGNMFSFALLSCRFYVRIFPFEIGFFLNTGVEMKEL